MTVRHIVDRTVASVVADGIAPPTASKGLDVYILGADPLREQELLCASN